MRSSYGDAKVVASWAVDFETPSTAPTFSNLLDVAVLDAEPPGFLRLTNS
jgi:hypothetical protein